MDDIETIETYKVWDCPQCGGVNDSEPDMVTRKQSCTHCETKFFIED